MYLVCDLGHSFGLIQWHWFISCRPWWRIWVNCFYAVNIKNTLLKTNPSVCCLFLLASDMSKNDPILSVWCVFICSALWVSATEQSIVSGCSETATQTCWQNIAGFPYDWPLWIFLHSAMISINWFVCVYPTSVTSIIMTFLLPYWQSIKVVLAVRASHSPRAAV